MTPTGTAEGPVATRSSRHLGRIVVGGLVVAMLAMWGYVLYLSFGPGRQPSPDVLDDPAFATAAQARCEAAHDVVAELPLAHESETAAERAAVITEANAVFAAMVDDLEALVPPGEDGEIVVEWLGDWRTYLRDREAYATALVSDPRAQLFVSAKDRRQVTEHLDAFAADNHMAACATPLDV